MHGLGWVVLVMALVEGGWLAFDGGRALVVGDYVTRQSAPGQLGPWSKVVSAVGIEPRSTLMKTIHLALGLWYLPLGTILSLIQIVLLLLPVLRSPGR
jgi:hypothetical protein